MYFDEDGIACTENESEHVEFDEHGQITNYHIHSGRMGGWVDMDIKKLKAEFPAQWKRLQARVDEEIEILKEYQQFKPRFRNEA